VIATVSEASSDDVDYAVKSAKDAFKLGSVWRTSDASFRSSLMHKLADLIERDAAHLAYLESLDNGKTFRTALNDDLPVTSDTFRYYAGWSDKIHGKTLPIKGNFLAYTRHEPVGVAGYFIIKLFISIYFFFNFT
jgi:aldehyde dehydrogenase (NAD+)